MKRFRPGTLKAEPPVFVRLLPYSVHQANNRTHLQAEPRNRPSEVCFYPFRRDGSCQICAVPQILCIGICLADCDDTLAKRLCEALIVTNRSTKKRIIFNAMKHHEGLITSSARLKTSSHIDLPIPPKAGSCVRIAPGAPSFRKWTPPGVHFHFRRPFSLPSCFRSRHFPWPALLPVLQAAGGEEALPGGFQLALGLGRHQLAAFGVEA